ncbi:branched-chain amino acid transaminase [Egibacter rhizosphaerae]|uniref:Branched-chain-amino-acid aminotransferase n=1 Tax=Egibacter rhizosphaerae TaxID=1670831 RepID=A0A411YCT1_9ACTN|nr:branched-chain amino acid transaminase [Egibacter rhizosphaerae]QBI19009.1 branched-chain amino acid transaminase [Egibacter rhizosphaerae]
MPISPVDEIWMDGEFVPWNEAQIHVLTPTLHYGWGVFEGIRAYETEEGAAVFMHRAHMERLHRSAKILQMDVPFSVDDLMQAARELIRRSRLLSCYIRPLVYLGYGEMGLNPMPSNVRVAIAIWPWGTYLGDEGLQHGVDAKVSSWVRIGANMIPTGTKACGVYINSSLAKVEALQAGYDEAILLNEHGEVAEGSGENVFIVRDGALLTPPLAAGVLKGLTREAVIEFAGDLGIPFAETRLLRQDLYTADEAFYTGTAAEVVPIRSVDGREIGAPGLITKRVQDTFFDTVAGREPRYRHMLDVVGAG